MKEGRYVKFCGEELDNNPVLNARIPLHERSFPVTSE
jgi:hypothetical protein